MEENEQTNEQTGQASARASTNAKTDPDREFFKTLKEEWPKLKAVLESHGIRLP